MAIFSFHSPKSIVFGSGAAAKIAQSTAGLLGPRVLVITDPGIMALGLPEPALADLRQSGHTLTIFSQVEPDPSVATLELAIAAGRAAQVTGVLGFGGGSSLDVAKVAALQLGQTQPLAQAWGVNQAQGPRLPLALVPTTAGTGAEATPVAILTVAGAEKRGISSPLLLPDLALVDPQLTLGLPPLVTAATGVDAMVHAIEAYSSINANNNPMSKQLALQALRLLTAHIETAVHQGDHLPAREAMAMGALLAGQAFANAPVAAVHALAYPLGGIFHIPHGLANALMLTAVMRFNLSVARESYAELSVAAFPQLANRPSCERAIGFIEALEQLILRLKMPLRLRDMDVLGSALPELAAEAMKQQRLLVNNPRPLTEADAFALYQAVW